MLSCMQLQFSLKFKDQVTQITTFSFIFPIMIISSGIKRNNAVYASLVLFTCYKQTSGLFIQNEMALSTSHLV